MAPNLRSNHEDSSIGHERDDKFRHFDIDMTIYNRCHEFREGRVHRICKIKELKYKFSLKVWTDFFGGLVFLISEKIWTKTRVI